MSQIQIIKNSLASLFRKEFAARIPTEPTLFEPEYWDFETGKKEKIQTYLNQIKNVYVYPVSLESEYPFCVIQDSNVNFPQMTQQKQDANINLEIAIWHCLVDLPFIDRCLELYANLGREILEDYENEIRLRNNIIKLLISDNRYSGIYSAENGWIRPVHIFLNIKTMET